jgi:hypothetical protein
MTTEITDTGVKGFLLWLKREQPGIYKKVAPQIAAQLPQAFSGYHDGGWRTAGLSREQIRSGFNRMSGLGDSSDYIDISNDLQPVQVTADYIPQTVDVATAANSGSTSSGLASAIGSLISGVSSLYMTKQQLDIQNQVVQTQLQRAAAGLPPLPTSISNLGVPQVAVGLSAGTGAGIAIAGGVLLLFMMMSGRKGKRA